VFFNEIGSVPEQFVSFVDFVNPDDGVVCSEFIGFFFGEEFEEIGVYDFCGVTVFGL
jgi:hypothetical protein